MKERKQYLDILRVLACMLVVLTHCTPPAPAGFQASSIHAFMTLICSPSPELFMAISGALLLPVRGPTGEFLLKRFLRVFPALLFWSSVIVAYRFFSQSVSLQDSLKALISMPIKPVLGIYWFFYVISGLYIFAPVISRWLLHASEREIRFFILLWGITLTLGSASILFDIPLIQINGSYYFILNSFGGFLGYMVLGSYLCNHTVAGRTVKRNVLIPIGILSFILLLAIVGYKWRIITAEFFIEKLSLATGLMVYSFFMLLKDLRVHNRLIANIIYDMSICSYGIYLVHFFIARDIVWRLIGYAGLAEYHPAIQIPISFVLSMMLSYLVVRSIRFLPFGKYIVG